MRDTSERKRSGLLAAAKRRVRSWIISGSGVSPVVLSVLVVALFGLIVVIGARLVALHDDPDSTPSRTAGILTPAPPLTIPPDVLRAPIAGLEPGPTRAAAPPVAAPRPDVSAPTLRPGPIPPEAPGERGPIRHPEATRIVPHRADDGAPEKSRAETLRPDGLSDGVSEPAPGAGQVQQRQHAQSGQDMEHAVGRSMCARWGISDDRCDEAVDEYQED